MLKDSHMHYTGSLPLKFVWENIVNRYSLDIENSWKNIFDDEVSCKECIANKNLGVNKFKSLIENIFSKDRKKDNLIKFFKLYALFQMATKSNDSQESNRLYRQGAYEIAKQNHQNNVNSYEVISGPRKESNVTLERLKSMVEGFNLLKSEVVEEIDSKIRLTFIRKNFNDFLNLDKKTLKDIFELILENKILKDNISGFDFSGFENPKDYKLILQTIRDIDIFNKKTGNNFSISIHAGENLIDWSTADYLDFFGLLINLPINTICHGTFLWIPRKYLKINRYQNKLRDDLLKRFAEKKVVFEICPSANLNLTPLSRGSEIPIKKFKNIGLEYSINTDDGTIFNTNINKETDLSRDRY